MAEQFRSGERNRNAQQDSVASVPSSADMDAFRKNVMIIAGVLNSLQEGDQTPDMLEMDVLAERNGIDSATDEPSTVTQAEFLYAIAVVCLKTVRRIPGHLNKVGWRREDVELFSRTFENLADAWSTYKRILRDLNHASWGSESSPDRVLAGLERPRRKYIIELDAYCVQLFVVLEYLDRATGLTTGA
jgi:hypothetical protein